MKVWLIADTHANHEDKMKTYCQRPTGYTDMIIRNCRDRVAATDILIHLGDVAIGPPADAIKFVQALPGIKWLIRGNHDGESPLWWIRAGFASVVDAMIFRHVWLTHKPAAALPEGTVLNVHGHLHNVWDGFRPPNAADWVPMPWQRLFAVEYTGYAPVEFDKFVNKPDKYQARGKTALKLPGASK